jgi:hypothetical protein
MSINNLLASSPAKPDEPAWSARAHVVDDLMRRAAYFALTGDVLACRVCVDAAKQLAADTWADYSVETHIRMWAETTADVRPNTPEMKQMGRVVNEVLTSRLPGRAS